MDELTQIVERDGIAVEKGITLTREFLDAN